MRCDTGDEASLQWDPEPRDAGADAKFGTGEAGAAVGQFAAHVGRGVGKVVDGEAERCVYATRVLRQAGTESRAVRHGDVAALTTHAAAKRVGAEQPTVRTRRDAPMNEDTTEQQCGRTSEHPPRFSTTTAATRGTGKWGESVGTGEACAAMGRVAAQAGRSTSETDAGAAGRCMHAARVFRQADTQSRAADRTFPQHRVLLSAGSDNKDDPGFIISGFY